jgi:hypothetical protein
MIQQFEIGGYTIKLGRQFDIKVADQNVNAIGVISCVGEDFLNVNVYFVDDESPVPEPTLSRDGNVGTLFLRKDMIPIWVDVLRNEKPIFGFIDTARPAATHITTKFEPVGQEETKLV